MISWTQQKSWMPILRCRRRPITRKGLRQFRLRIRQRWFWSDPSGVAVSSYADHETTCAWRRSTLSLHKQDPNIHLKEEKTHLQTNKCSTWQPWAKATPCGLRPRLAIFLFKLHKNECCFGFSRHQNSKMFLKKFTKKGQISSWSSSR
jgi:hypothetical protein